MFGFLNGFSSAVFVSELIATIILVMIIKIAKSRFNKISTLQNWLIIFSAVICSIVAAYAIGDLMKSNYGKGLLNPYAVVVMAIAYKKIGAILYISGAQILGSSIGYAVSELVIKFSDNPKVSSSFEVTNPKKSWINFIWVSIGFLLLGAVITINPATYDFTPVIKCIIVAVMFASIEVFAPVFGTLFNIATYIPNLLHRVILKKEINWIGELSMVVTSTLSAIVIGLLFMKLRDTQSFIH